MGRRKHNSAEARKEANKTLYVAKLMNNPTSPRKTRLVADLIRGVDVDNWQAKNEGKRIEDSQLYVKTIMVDEGRTMKRMRTAPQGRGYRIRKRSNHITMVIGSRADENAMASNAQTEE